MRILSRIRVNLDMLGDALGVVCIFGILIAGFWIAYGVGLPTGGDHLMGAV